MEDEEFTRWDAVAKNLGMINWWIVGIVAVVMLVIGLMKRWKFNYKKVLLFVIISVMPYVWYCVLANHSYLHWWFTYRLQMVTVVSLLMMVSVKGIGKSTFLL
jgi:hypothetical protein